MLSHGARQRLKNAFGAISMCLLLGSAACLAPHDAIAQTAARGTAPTTDSTSAEHHHVGTGDAAGHPRSADTATGDKTVSHDHPAGPHTDRNHAPEQQQALHAEIQKKFREFNAAFKKTTLAMTARTHRPPQIGAKVDHAQGQPSQPSPSTASAATQKPGANPQIVAYHRPAALTIPAPVREASASAPTNPHDRKPIPTALGGLAPYDPKKGAVLSGNTMHRRF